MAGSAFSTVGSPLSKQDSGPVQGWEILSASALLAQGQGLGFGLPPLTTTTPGLHTGRAEIDGLSRFRGEDAASLPQIAVVSASAAPSVEPFTEGWKPRFRIAGELLCSRPIAPLPDESDSLEPFLNLEQKPASSGAADDEMSRPLRTDKKPRFLHVDYSERGIEHMYPLHQQESSEEASSALEEGIGLFQEKPSSHDLSKPCIRKKYVQERTRISWKRWSLFNRKPYIMCPIALTTVLLGGFFIAYRSQSKNISLVHELSSSEVSKISQ